MLRALTVAAPAHPKTVAVAENDPGLVDEEIFTWENEAIFSAKTKQVRSEWRFFSGSTGYLLLILRLPQKCHLSSGSGNRSHALQYPQMRFSPE